LIETCILPLVSDEFRREFYPAKVDFGGFAHSPKTGPEQHQNNAVVCRAEIDRFHPATAGCGPALEDELGRHENTSPKPLDVRGCGSTPTRVDGE
jgi:hypothetical protein